jgi:hypothetical protein
MSGGFVSTLFIGVIRAAVDQMTQMPLRIAVRRR